MLNPGSVLIWASWILKICCRFSGMFKTTFQPSETWAGEKNRCCLKGNTKYRFLFRFLFCFVTTFCWLIKRKKAFILKSTFFLFHNFYPIPFLFFPSKNIFWKLSYQLYYESLNFEKFLTLKIKDKLQNLPFQWELNQISCNIWILRVRWPGFSKKKFLIPFIADETSVLGERSENGRVEFGAGICSGLSGFYWCLAFLKLLLHRARSIPEWIPWVTSETDRNVGLFVNTNKGVARCSTANGEAGVAVPSADFCKRRVSSQLWTLQQPDFFWTCLWSNDGHIALFQSAISFLCLHKICT